MKYEILLFDLVGVLLQEPSQITQTLLGSSEASLEEWFLYLMTSSAIKDFETGRASSQEFGEDVVRDLKLSLSANEFLGLFGRWIEGLYGGTEPLLIELSKTYRLGCFSNNNEIWWPQASEKFGLGSLFNDYFLSHEIGLRKPDRSAFEHVVQRLNMEPSRIAFFDDLEENVKTAQKVGMNAFVTKGLPQVQNQLNILGVLSYE